MKIGILTFHASHNYGSMLQNYALQRFLISEGHAVETINLRNERQRRFYNHPFQIGRTSPSIWKMLCRLRDPKWLIAEFRRWYIFEDFLKHYLILSKEYDDWSMIKDDLPNMRYDAIITGGDQIWSVFATDFDWSYFLPGDISPIKKISYSPSFGSSIPQIQDDRKLVLRIKECLERYDFLSVRETDASFFLHNLLGRDIAVVMDPVVLLDSSAYLELIGEAIIKEPYVFYYSPYYSLSNTPSDDSEEIAVELAGQLGLKIVTSYPRYGRRAVMSSVVAGPIEFLNLIYHAQVVVGKSYHLVVLSLMFHKEFATINFKDDVRVNALLDQFQFSGRNIESADDYKHLTAIDYALVDEEMIRLKNISKAYLRRALQE